MLTLESKTIHKSGLITGGRSTHNGKKKWEDIFTVRHVILKRLALLRMGFDAGARLVCLGIGIRFPLL